MICYVLVLAFLSGKVLALENEIKMIADVIAFYNKPPGIFVRACWRAPIKKKLINELNNMAPPKPMQFIRDVDDIPSSFTRHDLMIICDTNCSDNEQFLAKVNSTNKFRSPYRWLLITRSTENNKEILNDLKYFHILIDSEVLVSEKNGDTFSLYLRSKKYKLQCLITAYKLQSNGSDWKLESFGTWSLKHRLNNTKEMYTGLSMRRKNMDLFPITASLAITNNSTKKSLFSLKDLHIDLVTKAGYRQLLPLYQFMNATPVLLFANNWGHLVNGSYIGMLGHIARGDAELAGMVLFMTLERLDIVQFLSVPSIPTIKFVFRQPSLSYQNNLFILPFKPKVWYCIFGLIIFIFIIALINAKWESIKMAQEDNNLDRMVLRPDTSEIAMMIIGAVTQQGSYTEFKGTLGRVLMFIMFFVFLFLYTSYSANIVALLQSTSNQIRTLADLLNSKLELGVEDTPYNRYFFSAATEPVKKAIYEKKIAPRGSKANFISLQEGVLKLQKKPYAFNMFLGSGYRLVEKYFLEHEKCGLQEIAYIDENKPWQACGKKSPFKEIFKIGLFRNVEHGLNSRETRLLFAKKPSCSAHGGNFDSVYMRDFYPALLMLAYGVTLSIILLILEICHWRRFNKRKIIL